MTTWTVLGLFFQGLTFFVLSLTVAFLQYRSRRILLARHLTWVGVFALCEALVAWSDLLASLTSRQMLLPPSVRTAVLACGYAYLLAFGIQTFFPKKAPEARLRRILIWLNLAWLLPYGAALLFSPATFTQTALTVEVLARYLLALPGGLLTGIGIRRQSYETLAPEWRARVRSPLRAIEATAGVFGLLNLVLVPPATFFPATVLNTGLLPFPPALLWAAVGLPWAVGLTWALTATQMQIEDWIEDVERVQALSADRERISRELHDGTIQAIYAAGLMLEGVQHYIPDEPEKAQAQLVRIMGNLNQTIQDLRRYIFDLRSDTPDSDLEPGIRRLLRDFHVNTLLETDFRVTGEPPRYNLTIERRRHLFQIVREALANTSKHAHAQRVTVNLVYGLEVLDLTICDDGVGMEALRLEKGYGLRNIRERTRLLDGKLKIESAPHEGVMFHLTVPY